MLRKENLSAVHSRENLIPGHCPFCRVPITLGGGSVNKKVRCPKCRKLIIPNGTKEEAGTRTSVSATESTDPVQSELRASTKRVQETVTGHSTPEENGRKPEPIPTVQSGHPNETRLAKLMQHLQCGNENRQVAIRVSGSDPEALPFATFLKGIFAKAGWRTSEITPIEPGMRRGETVTLYAGPWPFPEEVTMTCMALTAAGVEFTSHMNPRQIHERVVLVISGKPVFTNGDCPAARAKGDLRQRNAISER